MTPPAPERIPDLTQELKRVKRDTDLALVDAACTLRRARAQAGMERWPALVAKCGMRPDDVRLFIELGTQRLPVAEAAPTPRAHPTVICGWCAHARAKANLPPKHLGGPESAELVVHDVCAECLKALDERLADLRRGAEEAHGQRHEALAQYHAEQWAQARTCLSSVLHFVDQAKEHVSRLVDNENVALRDGAREELAHLEDALSALQRLAAEIVLISRGDDYDMDELGTEPAP